jgi:PTS system galactitol-specific IIA component
MGFEMRGWTYPHLILKDLESRDSTQAITRLADRLLQDGLVYETFIPAVLEREKVFATGLPTPGRHVAIPHTDPEHVIHPAIAIAVLKHPVEFGEMGNPEARIAIEIVCLLAVKQCEALVALLQNLVELFQTPELLERIVISDPEEIAELFNQRLPLPEEA